MCIWNTTKINEIRNRYYVILNFQLKKATYKKGAACWTKWKENIKWLLFVCIFCLLLFFISIHNSFLSYNFKSSKCKELLLLQWRSRITTKKDKKRDEKRKSTHRKGRNIIEKLFLLCLVASFFLSLAYNKALCYCILFLKYFILNSHTTMEIFCVYIKEKDVELREKKGDNWSQEKAHSIKWKRKESKNIKQHLSIFL